MIGKAAKYVDEPQALEHVAGYCIVNDVSERYFQIERSGQWNKGKGGDNFGPIGPWLVTRDGNFPTPAPAPVAQVDGRRRQDGSTATMVFRTPFVVAYLSRFMSLQSGDVISTGTPAGVGLGQKPPMYLRAGNRVRLGIDGLGQQEQLVRGWNGRG